MADVKESENPRTQTLVRLSWEVWREALRSSRLLLQEGEPINWEEQEARERYYSYAPLLATKLYDDLHQFAAYLEVAPEKDQESRFEQVRIVLKEIKAINDKVEAGGKG